MSPMIAANYDSRKLKIHYMEDKRLTIPHEKIRQIYRKWRENTEFNI